MTTHKNITRILAVLLAVLLFGQLAAFQIPAFAADVVPDVHDGAAYIPDDADVNELLSQTLLSNYSDVGCQEWEYKATSTLSGGATKWVPVTGTTAGIIPALTAGKAGFPALDVLGVSYPALDSQSPAQDYAVRLKGTTEVYTFTKLAQPADADTDTPADTPAQTPDTTPADTPEEPADTPETSGETYQVNIPYTENGAIDFDALRAAIVAAALPDADAASELSGHWLLAVQDELEFEDSYDEQWAIGFEVVDERYGSLGTVSEIIQTPANDVWVVNGPYGEVLVPVIDDTIVSLPESDDEPITTKIMDGLIDS